MYIIILYIINVIYINYLLSENVNILLVFLRLFFLFKNFLGLKLYGFGKIFLLKKIEYKFGIRSVFLGMVNLLNFRLFVNLCGIDKGVMVLMWSVL